MLRHYMLSRPTCGGRNWLADAVAQAGRLAARQTKAFFAGRYFDLPH